MKIKELFESEYISFFKSENKVEFDFDKFLSNNIFSKHIVSLQFAIFIYFSKFFSSFLSNKIKFKKYFNK